MTDHETQIRGICQKIQEIIVILEKDGQTYREEIDRLLQVQVDLMSELLGK